MQITKYEQLKEFLLKDGYENLDTIDGFRKALNEAIIDRWESCIGCRFYYTIDRTCEKHNDNNIFTCINRLLNNYLKDKNE